MGFLLRWSQATDEGDGVPGCLPNTQHLLSGHVDTYEESLKSLYISLFGMEFLEQFATNDSFHLIPLSNLWHIQQSPACLRPHPLGGQ